MNPSEDRIGERRAAIVVNGDENAEELDHLIRPVTGALIATAMRWTEPNSPA